MQRRWPKTFSSSGKHFAGENALRLIDRYRDRLCTFNDDIQGTAAVTTATLLAAVHATGVPFKDQRIAMFGSGSAGVGIIHLLIAAMHEQGLTEAEARQRIYAFNRHGLIVEGDKSLRDSQLPFVRKPPADLAEAGNSPSSATGAGPISLLDTVRNAKIHRPRRDLHAARRLY